MLKVIGFLFLPLILFVSQALGGGDSVGCGGVIWACRSVTGGQVFYAGVLTDLFEAKIQGKLTIIPDPGGDPIQVYEARKLWLQKELPDLYQALKPRFEYVEKHQTLIQAELLSTHDFNNASKPLASTCPSGEWQPLNIANFREEDQQVLISSELWNSPRLPTLDKAALLFHEAVYYWMRNYYGSTNSDKARKITGLLFSTLPTAQMKQEITKILGAYPDHPEGKFMCVMKNSKRNQVYVAYDEKMETASLNVRLRCQDDADAQWCERGSTECEEVGPSLAHQCVAENSQTRKIYTGKGRNILEAQFNAHMACYIGSLALVGMEQHCPEFVFMECN
jgi:hypothetical protein